MYIDIDGSGKGKNSLGYDQFIFEVNLNTGEVTPFNHFDGSSLGLCNTFEAILYRTTTDHTCAAAWVVNYDTMDYLKLNNKKCPNGATPTETHSMCN